MRSWKSATTIQFDPQRKKDLVERTHFILTILAKINWIPSAYKILVSTECMFKFNPKDIFYILNDIWDYTYKCLAIEDKSAIESSEIYRNALSRILIDNISSIEPHEFSLLSND